MNKFRKKLASVVLSTSVLAGGVTTCLINSSTVDYCKATTPEEEMKLLLEQALCLVYSLPHNNEIPQGNRLTAGNFKKAISNIMCTLITSENKVELTSTITLVNFVIVDILRNVNLCNCTGDLNSKKCLSILQLGSFWAPDYNRLYSKSVETFTDIISADYRKAFWNLFPESFLETWPGFYRYEDIQADSIIAFLHK
ncbi:MAG: hypothetical protein J6K87_00575 [Clostridia bacterium]|nr:hypothetical protein [Clostridia bacterium]